MYIINTIGKRIIIVINTCTMVNINNTIQIIVYDPQKVNYNHDICSCRVPLSVYTCPQYYWIITFMCDVLRRFINRISSFSRFHTFAALQLVKINHIPSNMWLNSILIESITASIWRFRRHKVMADRKWEWNLDLHTVVAYEWFVTSHSGDHLTFLMTAFVIGTYKLWAYRFFVVVRKS